MVGIGVVVVKKEEVNDCYEKILKKIVSLGSYM
jgi:hypothetical protein